MSYVARNSVAKNSTEKERYVFGECEKPPAVYWWPFGKMRSHLIVVT